jgi:hypothetical protein
MRWPTRKELIFVIVGLILVSLLDWRIDYQISQYQHGGDAKQNDGSLFSGAVFLGLRDGLFYFWHLIGSNHAALLVVFTIGIFFVTAALAGYTKKLWGSTGDLVTDAKDTAERQLRAYVWTEITGKKDTPVGCIVEIRLKNSGKTPAYNVRCWAKGAAGGDEFAFEKAPADIPRPWFVIHPTTEHTLGVEFDVPTDAIGMIDKGKRIYVWGEVRYDDAFKKTLHKTQFRMFFHTYEHVGADGSTETIGIWRYCDEGNEAD